jgi:AraC-like DNA-binding protein
VPQAGAGPAAAGPVAKASDALLLGMIQLAFAVPRDDRPADLRCNLRRYEYALQLIEANLTREDLSLDWLAREMGLSARHLQRLFQENGAQVGGVVREKRLRLAAEGLALAARRGAVRVGEIAFRAGFRDPSNFHRAFKKAYGMPPREYAHLAGRRGTPA